MPLVGLVYGHPLKRNEAINVRRFIYPKIKNTAGRRDTFKFKFFRRNFKTAGNSIDGLIRADSHIYVYFVSLNDFIAGHIKKKRSLGNVRLGGRNK